MRDIDKEIVATIEEENELEAEIIENSAIQEAISDKISLIKSILDSVTPPTLNVSAPAFIPSEPSISIEPTVATTRREHVSRLPKLHLPTFSGNMLNWQSFWDSFDAAVHSNPVLDDVQKFNYLRTQLLDEASHAISGFTLTSANYQEAVALLQERFGETDKIIQAHMRALSNLPKPTNNASSLRHFYDTVESHIRGLSALGMSEESYSALLATSVHDKLPAETRQQMARSHPSQKWTLAELRLSVLTEIKVLEAGRIIDATVSSSGNVPTATASFYTGTSVRASRHREQGKPICCIYCHSQNHSSSSCNTVTDQQKRLDIVKKENVCFNCLGRHRVAQCKSKSRCKRCKAKHHTSLCENVDKQVKPPTQTTTESQPAPPATKSTVTQSPTDKPAAGQSNTSQSNTGQSQSSTQLTISLPDNPPLSTVTPYKTGCLLKTAVAMVRSGDHQCRAHILFDEGAQRSFITEQLAKCLSVTPTNSQMITISAFGGGTTPQKLDLASVSIRANDGSDIPISVFVVPKIAAPLQNLIPDPADSYPHLHGLPLAHPVRAAGNFEISLLVGADSYWRIVQDRVVRGNGPTAVESRIGYLLSGPLSPHTNSDTIEALHVAMTPLLTSTTNKQIWDVDFTGTTSKSSLSVNDSRIADYIDSSVSRQPDGSYVVKFPWKPNHPYLPSNRGICEKRTRSLARKLSQTSGQLKIYGNIIAEQLTRGFIEKVTEADIPKHGHFIPHHAVKKESVTTPIRIVYDCSCRQSPNHPCLNDCLEVGPPFLIDLCTLLLRFRTYNIALVTDIEKAFLQVQLDEADRKFTHFFWLSEVNNPESKLEIYRFRVVLFGCVSSPFMLHAALCCHLSNQHSTISNDVLANLYVDNVVSGCSTVPDALEYYQSARNLMSNAHFNLRSWASNSSEVRTRAQQDGVADKAALTNVLGLLWDTAQDTLQLADKSFLSLEELRPTKKAVLQDLSRVFDPLGAFTPVTISAKLFMQQLWQHKLKWDQPLTPELTTVWESIASDLKRTSVPCLPRKYFSFEPTDQLVLHTFVDASLKAYGAVVYICYNSNSSFVMAKARVAPLKNLTLPRLELMAALAGARLCSFVLSSLSNVRLEQIYMWSDSQIALHWIFSEKRLPLFVANRVQEIHKLLPDATWQYCPTECNPADLVTRGISLQTLNNSDLWKQGPSWLANKDQWPTWDHGEVLHLQATDEATEDPAVEGDAQPLKNINHIIDINRFSSWSKLLRVSAYVLRFIHNCKQKTATLKYSQSLSASEVDQAAYTWINHTQQLCYPKEFHALQSKGTARCRLPLVRQLKLFLNDKKLICCGGRIHNARIDDEAKFPCLLPKRHPITSLIVYHVHKTYLHSGVNATVTALRQKYWLPSTRQVVKSLLRKCVRCRRVAGKPYLQPNSPPLPSVRVKDARPFEITGVDFTGALRVKKMGDNKVYICLFTCGVTRAVHLEIVEDLSVETFLQALRRFAARRSLPRILISDNASTFQAAAKDLEELIGSDQMSESLCVLGVQWKFIPKRAPWYGGFWERLIGLTKMTLRKVLGKAFVTLPMLQTLIVEIEAVLNDRPLTHVSSDLSDPEPLTPSHLICGRRITSLPHTVVDEAVDPTYGVRSVTELASRQSQLIQHFQSRWRREYLTSLREYHRWAGGSNKQVIKVGDIVIIHDDTPRSEWKLATVEKLMTGSDGIVRAAEIRTAGGRTNRPIARLIPLEVNHDVTQEERDSTHTTRDSEDVSLGRPTRQATLTARNRIKEWTDVIRAAPEDVAD